jgi:hypothetical protein
VVLFKKEDMDTTELLRVARRFVGLIQESDLDDLIFVVQTAAGQYEGTYDSACSRFVDASGDSLGDDLTDLIHVRWAAGGSVAAGTVDVGTTGTW